MFRLAKIVNLSLLTILVGTIATTTQPTAPALGQQIAPTGERANYRAVSLTELNRRYGNLTGRNPGALVFSLFGLPDDITPQGGEQLEIRYPGDNRAVVTFTQMGLMDDSVRGNRYRVELVSSNNRWRVVWVGQQFRCQPNRGQQDWAPTLCL